MTPSFFEFTSYKFEPENKRIFFNYKTKFKDKEISYIEKIILPKPFNLSEIPQGLLDKVLSGLHIILGISYYKIHCATKVKVKYVLSEKEAEFWNTVYKKGLAEFFYKNKINPKNSPKFPFRENIKPVLYPLERNDKYLVAVGGGKDSIVATELLKEGGYETTAIFLETQKNSELVDKVIEIMGVKALKIRRFLDKKLFQKGEVKYSGHIPISAIYAFLCLLSSVLYKYSYIVVANEYSSNFGNIKYKGEIINHQWSKSSEFENLFRDYIKNFISPDIFYFSLLRPFYEIRIVELFLKYKKYFLYFSSCNQNFKINRKEKNQLWCGQCSKCVFVFTLLSAFLPKKDLIDIFQKNLYQDKNLLPIFRDILGFGKMKPFDCVGTFEETTAALYLASKKFKNDLVIKNFLPKIKNPKDIIKEVFKTNPAPNIPAHLRFLGMKNALILGYGKEGQVTKKYIKKNFPNLKIGVADMKLSKNYLEKQKKYDIAVKTPGIPKNLVRIPYTTATNIFFSQIKNKTIGITGTKGKSTTASLIYAILKEDGKKVRLLGNIGNPMLEVLMVPIKKDEIFVLELSSYQLEDINFSPDIAVVINLFPEHMNYHGSVEKYYDAKKNIIKFQNKDDLFIYNPKYKKLVGWTKESKAKAIPFVSKIPLKNCEIPLIGKHNKENIKAAITVARAFNISDEIIKKAIKKFHPLPHRLEFVGEFKGIKFYDDAISTTPESTIMAIKSLPKIGTIMLGGEDRGYNFSQLEKTIKKYKIKNIILFPESGKRILKSKKGFNVLKTSSMKEAVKFAYKYTKKGSVCLLSCASPSYSLWKNFEEKGNLFQRFVKRYSRETEK